MKRIITLTCVVVIGLSLVNIFKVDDALVHFIVLGRVPGTELTLDIFAITGLSLLTIPMIGSWISTFNAELIESKLGSIRSDAISSYEEQVATTKLEGAKAIAQQLEIDELDAITL